MVRRGAPERPRRRGRGRRGPGTFGGYAVTGRPDELCARARAAGAEIIKELTDTDYGSREFGVRDPEGNLWWFGTYRGEPRTA
ncbi:VOC family protein [Streptomyces sp. NPDC058773]|uniref:VOC family protein n=1 Tax=Streptomyces sp. NPDC058773 TaxID=3346632 RepID=UPI0036A0C93E